MHYFKGIQLDCGITCFHKHYVTTIELVKHSIVSIFYFRLFCMLLISKPLLQKIAYCFRYLAMVLYHAGDMKGAITQQHKELIINERCLGLDHPDTAHRYMSFLVGLFHDNSLNHITKQL